MTKNDDVFSFEESLLRLEEIAALLENGTVSLDESIKLYEEGIYLSDNCVKTLCEAKRKIEIIKTAHYEKNDIEADVVTEI